MDAVFLKILNMSITASWLVLAVLLLRLVLTKAPKWVNCLLWAMVAVRLVCPFSLESSISLIPQSAADGRFLTAFTDDYVGNIRVFSDITEEYDQAVSAGRVPISIEEGGSYVVTAEDGISAPPTVETEVLPVFAAIWLAGMAGMMLYAWISCRKIKKKIAPSVVATDLVRICDYIDSPFIFGVLNPKIYLPSDMDQTVADCVLAHEKAHIQRRDHWWKPLGYLLLTLHWFNPVMWLAYVLLCRDIELACDEKVIRELGEGEKRQYSEALLSCSVPRRMVAACPLAFGEVGVKERVKRVLSYQKPAFWIILTAVIVCVVVAMCFLTNPAGTTLAEFQGVTDEDYASMSITAGGDTVELFDEAKIGKVKSLLQTARIVPEPVSQDRSEDRPKDYGVTLSDINTTFWFNSDFSQMWVEDSVKPSLTYSIKRPEQVCTFFAEILGRDIPDATAKEPEDASVNATNVEIDGRQLLVASTENADYQDTAGRWLTAGEEAYQISLFLPWNWEYEILENQDEIFFRIAIWPADQQEGKLSIECSSLFALCGTELITGDVVLSRYRGSMGTYYGNDLFDYVSFHGKTVHYVIHNNKADLWWDAYGTEAMEILNTLILNDCHATEEEVIANAEAMAKYLNYETVEAEYDATEALWLVRFRRDGGETLVTTVRMDSAGNYIDTIRE